MFSILNKNTSQNLYGKTLNFIVVNYGEQEAVDKSVKFLEKLTREVLAKNKIILLDESCEKAEANPDLLTKSKSLRFKTSCNYHQKCYFGFFDVTDFEKLWQHLFSMPSEINLNDIKSNYTYYSKSKLLELLTNEPEFPILPSENAFDLLIDYSYTKDEYGKIYSKIGFHINEICIDDLPYLINRINEVITLLDLNHPSAFQSAYISLGCNDKPIIHNALYKSFSYCNLYEYILGTEWSVYFSRRIYDKIPAKEQNALAKLAEVKMLNSGVQYIADTDIKEFSNITRRKISSILCNILMPAFGTYSWFCFCSHSHEMFYSPKGVAVYYNEYSPNDPIIVFFYNIDFNILSKSDEFREKELMYVLKLDV